jgi:hypothetical protein
VTPPLPTLRSLARRPSVRAAAIVLPLAGFAAGWLPLLDAPGYELAEAGALLAGVVVGPWAGGAGERC